MRTLVKSITVLMLLFSVHGKTTNICRRKDPSCRKSRVINISGIVCDSSHLNPTAWNHSQRLIAELCNRRPFCAYADLQKPADSCCGGGGGGGPNKLKLIYTCPKPGAVFTTVQKSPDTDFRTNITTAASVTPLKTITVPAGGKPVASSVSSSTFSSPTATKPVVVTTDQNFLSDTFCSANLCKDDLSCAMNKQISIISITNKKGNDSVLERDVRFFCNSRRLCSREWMQWSNNLCTTIEDFFTIYYTCIQNYNSYSTMCQDQSVVKPITDSMGELRSKAYPSYLGKSDSDCSWNIIVNPPAKIEFYLLDVRLASTALILHAMENDKWKVVHTNKSYMVLSPVSSVYIRYRSSLAYKPRLWIYYRVLREAAGFTAGDLIRSCRNESSTPTTRMSSAPPAEATPTVMKPGSSAGPTTKGEAIITQATASIITKADGKAATSRTAPDASRGASRGRVAYPSGVSASPSGVSRVSLHEKTVTPSLRWSSLGSSIETTDVTRQRIRPAGCVGTSEARISRLYERPLVIGLIIGIAILACLVIILLIALIVSMRRQQRRSGYDRQEGNPTGTDGGEPLASFQYLVGSKGPGFQVMFGSQEEQDFPQEASDDEAPGPSGKHAESDDCSDYSKLSLLGKRTRSGSSEPSDPPDSARPKDEVVFHYVLNGDKYAVVQKNEGGGSDTAVTPRQTRHERRRSSDMKNPARNDNSFQHRKLSDSKRGGLRSFSNSSIRELEMADLVHARASSSDDGFCKESKMDDDVFQDVPHFFINGDDYAIVHKNSSRSPDSPLGLEHAIYANTSPGRKSSGSIHDQDLLDWTKGFNLAV